MQVHQLADGLWRWSVGDRTSAYLEHGDVMIIVDPLLATGKSAVAAIDRLLQHHQSRLPSTLYAGDEVVSSLEDESLFPDTIYVMTACGSNAA